MNGLYLSWQEKQAEKREQEELRKKHNITDDKVKVVEKNNYLKYVIKGIKLVANILVYILASVGLIALIYPTTHQGLIAIADEVIRQLREFI